MVFSEVLCNVIAKRCVQVGDIKLSLHFLIIYKSKLHLNLYSSQFPLKSQTNKT